MSVAPPVERPEPSAAPEDASAEPGPSRVVRLLDGMLTLPLARVLDISATQRCLSLFRIGLYAVVLFETWSIFRIRDFAVTSSFGRDVLVPVCMVASVVAMAGLFTRATSIVVIVAFKMLQPDLYGWYEVDWVIELFGLLFCFAPASTTWSLDARRRGIRKNERVSPVFVLTVTLVMTIIYYDSVLTKLDSVIWRDGIAVWLATFVPYAASVRLPSWMEVGPLLRAMAYATIVYETLFFLVLLRPARRVVAYAGLGLHLGIAVLTPLRGFGLIMAAPVLLFLQNGDRGEEPAEDDSRRPTDLLRQVFQRRLLPVLTIVYCLLVASSFVHMKAHASVRGELTRAMGVHPTGVYADGKFAIPAPILRLEITTSDGMEGLPSFDEDGYTQVYDRLWKHFGFFLRARSAPIDQLERYVEMYRDRCDVSRCEVDVYAKDVSMPLVYDESFIDEIRDRPWTRTGSVTWRGDGAMRWEPAPGVPSDKPWP